MISFLSTTLLICGCSSILFGGTEDDKTIFDLGKTQNYLIKPDNNYLKHQNWYPNTTTTTTTTNNNDNNNNNSRKYSSKNHENEIKQIFCNTKLCRNNIADSSNNTHLLNNTTNIPNTNSIHTSVHDDNNSKRETNSLKLDTTSKVVNERQAYYEPQKIVKKDVSLTKPEKNGTKINHKNTYPELLYQEPINKNTKPLPKIYQGIKNSFGHLYKNLNHTLVQDKEHSGRDTYTNFNIFNGPKLYNRTQYGRKYKLTGSFKRSWRRIIPRTCPTAFFNLGSRCYFYGHFTLNWFRASEFCHSFGQRVTLAVIETHEENITLRKWLMVNGNPKSGVWIGGSQNGHENIWSWFPTGYLITYQDWCHSQPDGGDQHCMYMVGGILGYRWADFHCEFDMHFLCEYQVDRNEPW